MQSRIFHLYLLAAELIEGGVIIYSWYRSATYYYPLKQGGSRGDIMTRRGVSKTQCILEPREVQFIYHLLIWAVCF